MKVRLYSIREAAKILDCSVPTIQGDIASRALVPYELATHRSPKGSRLDFSDLVLDSCFRDLASARVNLAWVQISHEILGGGGYGIIDQLPRILCDRVLRAPQERIFQAFIEAIDYKAYLIALPFYKKGNERRRQLSWQVLPVWSETLAQPIQLYFDRAKESVEFERGRVIVVSAVLHAERVRARLKEAV